jgi:phage terminase large subunit
MEIKINEKYKPLYYSDKRYFLITGGRGSGKSFGITDFLLRLTYEKGHGVLFTRYTMTSAETSIIPEFIQHIERLGVEEHFHVTSKDIYNKRTGSFIWFRGIKASSNSQKANLKSLAGVTTFVVEEGEDFQDEKTFDTIDDSIRTTLKQNRVIWIQNPSSKEHFIYNRWVENNPKQIEVDGHRITISGHPEVEQIHTTYLDNIKNLSDSFIKKAKKVKENNPEWYKENYLGAWKEKEEGVIFENWEIIEEWPEDLTVIYGIDWGYKDPFTLTKIAIKDERLYAQNLVYQSNLTPTNIVDLVGAYCSKDDLIICDNADISMIMTMQEAGFNAIPCLHKDKVVVGIRSLQDYTISVYKSSNLVKELNHYKWLDKRGEVAIDNYNHIIDPIRYVLKYYKLSNA